MRNQLSKIRGYRYLIPHFVYIVIFRGIYMKKQTKNILTKLALVAAPFVFATTIINQQESFKAQAVSKKEHEKAVAEYYKFMAEYKAHNASLLTDDEKKIGPSIDSDSTNNQSVAKNTVKKAAKKKVVKKHVAKKKAVKKHARHLFAIKVKASKVYAYKNTKMSKAGRKAEKKGTKLYVYGIVKKGHKTFYKINGGRVITSSHKYVTKVAK